MSNNELQQILSVHRDDHRTGNPDSKNVLIYYGDYECSHCKKAHLLIGQLLDKRNDLLLIFRHFPLQEIHPHAIAAALATEAAGRQDRFWILHNLLFELEQDLSLSLILDCAKEANLDLEKFASAWQAQKTLAAVESDFKSGVDLGVNGTPTFFLNGSETVGYNGTYKWFESLLK